MSLSCIVQTLWDQCQYQVIIEETDANYQKHLLKNDKICLVAYSLKNNENKGDVK